MNISKLAQSVAPFIIILFLQPTLAVSSESGRVYLPSDDPMADVDEVLARAGKNDKLALIIMGGNWCHDSRALASRLAQPEMTPIMSEHYEVEFVDVGYLDTAMDVIRRFGQPIIYGTPTVLIVDPETGRVINFDTSPRWRDATRISMADTVEYFSAMAEPMARADIDDDLPSPRVAALLAEIDEFERVQAEKLYEAFAVLGPMLEQADNGNRAAEFDEYWHQVADMRAKITDDLAELRSEARRMDAENAVEIALEYPEYPAFAWEKE